MSQPLTMTLVARLSAAALASVVFIASAMPSHAAPPAIVAKQAEAARAREQLDELAADLEERSEEYLAAEDDLEKTRQAIREAEADLEVAEADVALSEALFNARIDSIYRHGKVDIVSVFVGVNDFPDLVARLDLLQRIGASDAAVVVRVKDARARIAELSQSLENRRTEQVALLQRAKQARNEVDALLERQEKYLASLNAELQRLIAEERERQERLAAQRAAAAAAEAARKRAEFPSDRSFDETGLPEPHPEVVAFAQRYVGKTPYVWGGITPAGFDCSGLTMYCYRLAGVSIPRTSRQQYRFGAFIPPDRLDLLQPGDLVFFGRGGDPNRVHHVGLYAGNGNFVHAPQRGMKVSIGSLTGRIAEKGDYVGATRP